METRGKVPPEGGGVLDKLQTGQRVKVFTVLGVRYIGRVSSVGVKNGETFLVVSLNGTFRPKTLKESEIDSVSDLDKEN